MVPADTCPLLVCRLSPAGCLCVWGGRGRSRKLRFCESELAPQRPTTSSNLLNAQCSHIFGIASMILQGWVVSQGCSSSSAFRNLGIVWCCAAGFSLRMHQTGRMWDFILVGSQGLHTAIFKNLRIGVYGDFMLSILLSLPLLLPLVGAAVLKLV